MNGQGRDDVELMMAVRGGDERAFASLPERQREVFVLCHLQGFTCVETAAMLGVPVGTVKSRMSAAVHKLRDMLKDWSEPE